MFGFFTRKRLVERAVTDAVYCCNGMFAGLEIYGKPVPKQVFADPYIIGFLQQLIIHAVFINQRRVDDGKTMLAVSEATLEALAPGFGQTLMSALVDLNDPSNALHTNYKIGRREGLHYTIALMDNDVATWQANMLSFRSFVKRNYLGVVSPKTPPAATAL